MATAVDDGWANPSSVHAAGQRARALLESARGQVAGCIGAKSADLVFTSGGTEAVNAAIVGLAQMEGARTVVSTTVEHPAVAESVDALANAGCTCLRLDVRAGRPPTPEQLAQSLRAAQAPALVALQWVNHEVGTVLPIADYARVCKELGARLVVDATQALGKLPIDAESAGVDALALAAHKMGGPAGAGALWLRRGTELGALLRGGGQERGRRPGSPDVLACAGFGAAAAVLPQRLADQPRIARLRDRLEAGLAASGGVVNGNPETRVATVTNVSFPGRTGQVLVAALDVERIAVSAGAACSSGVTAGSAVLGAMYPEAGERWRATSSVRFSLGPESTDAEVDAALAAVGRVLARPPG